MICRMPRSSKPASRSRSWCAGVTRVASFGDQRDVVEHRAVLRREGRVLVVFDQRLHERLVQRHGTQKLCVGLQSIVAAVERRDVRRDHLVLRAAQRQVRRQQRPEGGEGVVQRLAG